MNLDKYLGERHFLLLDKTKIQLQLNVLKKRMDCVNKKLDNSDLMLIKNYKPVPRE